MVREITSKEERGTYQSAHHTDNMKPFPVTENRQPTGRNQAGTDCVQGRIDWGQIENIHELQTIRGTYFDTYLCISGQKQTRLAEGDVSACRYRMSKALSSVGLSFSSASCVWQPHEAELKLSPTDEEPRLIHKQLGDDCAKREANDYFRAGVAL